MFFLALFGLLIRLGDIQNTYETNGRWLFKPEKALKIAWVKANKAFYEEGLRRAVNNR